MRECEAYLCTEPAKHYVPRIYGSGGMHFCYMHAEKHRMGYGFTVVPDGNKSAAAVLTGEGPTAILTLPAHTIASPEEAPMSNGTLSTLADAQSEIREKLDELSDAISELESAREQLEDALGNVEAAISTIEELDGLSVDADVNVSVDFSIYL